VLTTAFATHLAQHLVEAGGFVLAVGRGDAAWDEALPAPDPAAAALVDERARVVVPPEGVVFLDDAGVPSPRPTPRLQFTATLEGIGSRGPLREVGWFAGGTATTGSGTLLAAHRHARIDATANLHITQTLRLDLRGTGGGAAGPSSRYLANTHTEELHDLQRLTTNCQIDEIRVDRRYAFATVAEALAMGYDRCAYCFGRAQSER